MALDKTVLKSRIIAELQAQGFNTSAMGKDNVNWLDKFATAIANAIIDEIQQDAQVVGKDSNNDDHNLQII